MKFVLLILLFVSVITVLYGKHAQMRKRREVNKCQDRCIPLRSCHPFLEMLRNRVPGTKAMVRHSRCGSVGLRVKVCCPNSPTLLDTYFPPKCGNNPRVSEHIVFGEETEMGEHPWVAAFGYKKPDDSKPNFMCSGSVINARYVLTAAHCLDPGKLKGYILSVVRVGDWDLSKEKDCFESYYGEKCAPPHIDLHAEKTILHPMYNVEHQLANDIALIRLNQTIDFSKAEGYIMPICLPPFGLNVRSLTTNQDLVVVGWGKTEKQPSSHVLLQAEVPFANQTLCSQQYTRAFGNKQLCVGGTLKDSCQGDSGSPLMLAGPTGPPYLQVGIVSFGSECGTPGKPAVYTSVSPYRQWIADNLEPW